MIRRLSLLFATFWVRSLRPRFAPKAILPPSGILVLWHADMLSCLRAFTGKNMRVLISQSRDGAFGADAAESLGYRVVRGSSSQGGATALKALAQDLRANGGWIALVADGPRGPRYLCKPGAEWLARATEIPVTCLRAQAPRGFTLGGWARVRVPLPFSRVMLRMSAPFHPETPEEIDAVMRGLGEARGKG